MTIQIPDHLLANHPESEVRLRIGIALFHGEISTLAQASRFSGISRWDFQKELAERKIPVHYDIEEVDQDLKP